MVETISSETSMADQAAKLSLPERVSSLIIWLDCLSHGVVSPTFLHDPISEIYQAEAVMIFTRFELERQGFIIGHMPIAMVDPLGFCVDCAAWLTKIGPNIAECAGRPLSVITGGKQ